MANRDLKETPMTFEHDLKASVRTIPDYPKPGILFRDITTLLGDARSFRRAVDELVQPWAGNKIDKVAGIEARGAGMAVADLAQLIQELTSQMHVAAGELHFELAARLRDEIADLKKELRQMTAATR